MFARAYNKETKVWRNFNVGSLINGIVSSPDDWDHWCIGSEFFDISDNQIYAGDIIQRGTTDEYFPLLVCYGDYDDEKIYGIKRQGFYFLVSGNKDLVFNESIDYIAETHLVIGNIYQNPELLVK